MTEQHTIDTSYGRLKITADVQRDEVTNEVHSAVILYAADLYDRVIPKDAIIERDFKDALK